jgi:hypothetical protein
MDELTLNQILSNGMERSGYGGAFRVKQGLVVAIHLQSNPDHVKAWGGDKNTAGDEIEFLVEEGILEVRQYEDSRRQGKEPIQRKFLPLDKIVDVTFATT